MEKDLKQQDAGLHNNLLEHWQDRELVYIPPLETKGWTEHVLSRDIWNTKEVLEEKAELSDEPRTEQDTEERTVLLQVHEEKEHAYIVRIGTNERIDIEYVPFVIGKGSGTDYQLKGNEAISREHIRITQAGNEYQMEDLDSLNHTYIEQQEIHDTVMMHNGQSFKLADEEFCFYVEKTEV